MQDKIQDRIRGCAVGAAIGDALGMPLEFGSRRPADQMEREMRQGRLPAGTFTDDTEMALEVAGSLLAHRPLEPSDLAQRFAAWYRAAPADIGIQTAAVLSRVAAGEPWSRAVESVQRQRPNSAGNGSVMRCWPVALAHWDNVEQLQNDSRLQSRITHPHPECEAGSAFINVTIYYLLRQVPPREAIRCTLDGLEIPQPLKAIILAAPARHREQLANSGWVRHTLESATWGLVTTASFEEAVVQVVNLGGDADTAGAVVGALAGAAYGLEAIPGRWREALRGEWPLGSGLGWRVADVIDLADQLAAR